MDRIARSISAATYAGQGVDVATYLYQYTGKVNTN